MLRYFGTIFWRKGSHYSVMPPSRPWGSPVPEWTTSCLCVLSLDTHGDSVCVDSERVDCNCVCLHAYVYGRAVMNVETNHQPLEYIVKKPLDKAPKRPQRMPLSLQKYSEVQERETHVYCGHSQPCSPWGGTCMPSLKRLRRC